MNVSERINAVAQRLDELADEGSSELTTLAEELGRIADDIPVTVAAIDPAQGREKREWMHEMEQLMERVAVQIVSDRYGRSGQGGAYATVNIPTPQYFQSATGLSADYVRHIMKGVNGV